MFTTFASARISSTLKSFARLLIFSLLGLGSLWFGYGGCPPFIVHTYLKKNPAPLSEIIFRGAGGLGNPPVLGTLWSKTRVDALRYGQLATAASTAPTVKDAHSAEVVFLGILDCPVEDSLRCVCAFVSDLRLRAANHLVATKSAKKGKVLFIVRTCHQVYKDCLEVFGLAEAHGDAVACGFVDDGCGCTLATTLTR